MYYIVLYIYIYIYIYSIIEKIYIDALKNSGFREEFTYQEENIPNNINKEKKKKKYSHKNRKRNIIWSNPPFCRLACINVGKYLLKLIDKHFKHDNILHKIFNRKTLKISYSCTKNIFQIINNHNKEIIKEFQDRTNNNNNNNCKQNECNCKTRNNCPMNGLCNLNNVVYQGIIYPKENRGCPRGVMVKAMDCGIVVREFVLQSRYYVHFRTNTLGKGMNLLILPAIG